MKWSVALHWLNTSLREKAYSNIKEMLSPFLNKLFVFDTQSVRLKDVTRLAVTQEHCVVHDIAQVYLR